MYKTISESVSPVTLLLKGAPGTGKTYKAAHFPQPVIFNFDNNLRGLRQLPDDLKKSVRTIRPTIKDDGTLVDGTKVWDTFIQQLKIVASDNSVGTIVIDSLTTLSEVLLDKIVESSLPTVQAKIQHWGEFGRYLKWLGQEFLCAKDLDKHIVFIAHEQIERDETTQSLSYTLNIGGRLRTSYDLYFSDCWRTFTRITPKGVQYLVRTVPGVNFTAKNTLGLPAEFVWDELKNEIMERLIKDLGKNN